MAGAPAPEGAIGSTSFILIAAFSMFMFIGAGVVLSLVVQPVPTILNQIYFIGQSLRGTIFIAIVYCLTLILSAPIMPDVVGLSGTSAEMMESYLTWLGYTGFFLAFGPVIDAIYISMGNTKFPMLLKIFQQP